MWKMKSDDGQLLLDVAASGSGDVKGHITFQDVSYQLTGRWAAADSVPGRNYSAFWLGGNDGQSAPDFLAVAGTMKGSGSSPESISMNLIRTDSTDGLQFGWSGTLLPA